VAIYEGAFETTYFASAGLGRNCGVFGAADFALEEKRKLLYYE